MAIELFGTNTCPYTADLRDDLEWRDVAFVEHDVEADRAALERMLTLTGGERTVPVLVEDGPRDANRVPWPRLHRRRPLNAKPVR